MLRKFFAISIFLLSQYAIAMEERASVSQEESLKERDRRKQLDLIKGLIDRSKDLAEAIRKVKAKIASLEASKRAIFADEDLNSILEWLSQKFDISKLAAVQRLGIKLSVNLEKQLLIESAEQWKSETKEGQISLISSLPVELGSKIALHMVFGYIDKSKNLDEAIQKTKNFAETIKKARGENLLEGENLKRILKQLSKKFDVSTVYVARKLGITLLPEMAKELKKEILLAKLKQENIHIEKVNDWFKQNEENIKIEKNFIADELEDAFLEDEPNFKKAAIIISALALNGYNIDDFRDASQSTPLLMALNSPERGSQKYIKFLLELGSNPNAENAGGLAALSMAVVGEGYDFKKDKEKLLDLLLNYGADMKTALKQIEEQEKFILEEGYMDMRSFHVQNAIDSFKRLQTKKF